MNNPIVLKATFIISFIISAIFTIMLMTSGIVEVFPYILTAITGIILELAKCGLFYEALTNQTLNKIVRAVMIIISLILIGSSILASSAFILNQANKTKNKQIQSSTQFQQLEQARILQQDLYRIKKNEIEDLKALKISQKLDGDKIISTMPRNYTDKKNAQRAITSNQIADTQRMIDKKSTELSQIELKLQTPINTSNFKINSEHGYTSIFVKMAEMINTTKRFKNNPVTPETMEMWFYMLLMVLFEFVTVIAAYLAQLKSKIISNTIEPFDSTELKRAKDTETLDTTESYKGLGIDKDKIEQYVDYMYSKLKNGNICRGYNTIGQYTGLGVDNARKIKSHLQKLGIIHTVGTKTYTQVDLQTCKAKLQI